MKHLYFVRHGLSVMNEEGKYAGSADTPLTDIGREQAKKAGKHINENSIPIDIIICSPLSRAHETAKLIAVEMGYDHEQIIIHDGLVERHFGVLEGIDSSESGISRSEYMEDPFALDHIEDVEKIVDLQHRANLVFEELRSMPHETILVVSHGAFGRAFNRSAKKIPLTEFGEYIENAQIIKLK